MQRENGDSFVVERAGDRARNVAGRDRDESGREEARARVPELLRQKIRRDRRQARKNGRREDAHVLDVRREAKRVQEVMDTA